MSLAPDDKKLMGARFVWLLDASQITGTELARRMKVSMSTITKLKAGDSMTIDHIKSATYALKGEGQLVDDQDRLILFWMSGTDTRTVLRPTLRLVGEDQPDNPTSGEGTTRPYAFPAAA